MRNNASKYCLFIIIATQFAHILPAVFVQQVLPSGKLNVTCENGIRAFIASYNFQHA
jgi:hypothetical protein